MEVFPQKSFWRDLVDVSTAILAQCSQRNIQSLHLVDSVVAMGNFGVQVEGKIR